MATIAATPLMANGLAENVQAQADPTATAADALFEIVRGRYAKFLTPAQLQSVKRSVTRNQQMAELLRQTKLDNSDEPAFVFRADLP